jgi:hypothetical protein
MHGLTKVKAGAVELRAGPLMLVYESGSLRNISIGNCEIINHVYISLRDRSWVEVPCKILDQKIEIREDSFQISFNASNEQGEIRYRWQAEITGSSSGVIRYG